MGKQNGKRYHFLYRTTNLVNDKYYYGVHSTYNLLDGYLGSGKRLKRAVEKYGAENFKIEILEFFESREEVLKREKEVVNETCLQDPLCMNLQTGGGGGISSKEHHKKLKEGASEWIRKKWKDPKYRNKMIDVISKEMKLRHQNGKVKYNSFAGKKHTEKTKNKMSEKAKLRIGNKNSQFGTCWICKNKEVKKIKKTDLDIWLNKGWKNGRI